MRVPAKFFRLLFSSAALWIAVPPVRHARAQAPPPNEPPQIHVTVNRVNVPVTVTDSDGHPVPGLHRDDFHIFDNGIEQPITDFASVEESTQVVLLIESGPAVLFLAKNHVLAADAFLRSMPAADSVAMARST